MSDVSSTSHEDNTDKTLEYTLNRGETSAEFTPNNGEFVTIFYDGTWEYEDSLKPYSYEIGIWTLDKDGKPIIESHGTYPHRKLIESLIEKALQVLGYVKA